ncbi:PREDICTED: uncharacterized protein LOC106817385 [Priapulus caudatus]|uniref:Uncharacterized protein LOC106817385 n=1 Tax=Priapulus caudatus TaxID=37621 RepID=A0ABM1EZB3_PRICU|nr:PREDICTED: uncharacterized protein LOC106817385 [Priapulus caudatus]
MDNKAVILVAMIAFMCVLSGEAIKCYVCNTYSHVGCNSTDLTSYEKDCDSQYPGLTDNILCRVISQKVEGLAEKRVVRECGEETHSDDKQELDFCWNNAAIGYKQIMLHMLRRPVVNGCAVHQQRLDRRRSSSPTLSGLRLCCLLQ